MFKLFLGHENVCLDQKITSLSHFSDKLWAILLLLEAILLFADMSQSENILKLFLDQENVCLDSKITSLSLAGVKIW